MERHKSSDDQTKVFVISHTHWDREWYQDFQSFRVRLVYLIDELIDTMERNSAYRYFMMDGQTIVIDDYLAIRPENRERLLSLIEQGRIDVGPWYVMPDEFLPDGESLIRNLQTGVRRARSWNAEPLLAGYLPDLFGHISQMPQILQGFGIDNAVLYRGLDGRSSPSELWWEGADGSRVLTLRLEEERSYGDFYFAVRWPFEDRDFTYDGEEVVRRARDLLQLKRDRALTDRLVVWDGVDHVEIEPCLPDLLHTLNGAGLGADFQHARFDDYMRELRPLARETWPVVRGEQRFPGYAGLNHMVLANVLSSRIHLKQHNDQCETLLTRWAEPWGVFSSWEGRPYHQSFLQQAWEILLQNHPHDSICGCSIDQVHRDMLYRFDQSRLIAESMLSEQLTYIANSIDAPWSADDRTLVLFNASQYPLDGIATADVELPSGTDASQTIRMLGGTSFRLFDAEGREMAYQVLGMETGIVKRVRPFRSVPVSESVDRIRIAFKANIPSFGYSAYRVQSFTISGPAFGEYAAERFVAPVRHTGTMRTDNLTWNNGRYIVRVADNGSIGIEDLHTNRAFDDLVVFESEGDIGDGWKHIAPLRNSYAYSAGCPAEISVEADGPLFSCIKIAVTMQVPAFAGADLNGRSEETVPLRATTCLEIRKNDPVLRIQTVVDNRSRNHRFRVLFPTSFTGKHYRTNTAFDLVERTIEKPNFDGYLEKWADVVPHSGLIVINDDTCGVAVYSEGLHELTLREQKRTIALTLFRATGDEVLTNGSDGGQLLGRLTFDYALRLFDPDQTSSAQLWTEHARFKSSDRSLTRKQGPIRHETPHRREPTLPLSNGYLTLAYNRLIVTAIKQSEDEKNVFIVRLFNAENREISDRLRFAFAVESADYVSLNEDRPYPIRLCEDGSLDVTAKSKGIVTIRLRIAIPVDGSPRPDNHTEEPES
ncbi:hypothetical protein H7C19_13955 [Cohnella nanjingensis]|uniref:Glycoside hydrolase family 38 central domain-containing protein n=2 Tax=Cohnella nanjingensis TaxID=1387779 RepID=A0A7X0RSS0_9BACL|nr:hypothetical protein [Cohnella nanjingensis]